MARPPKAARAPEPRPEGRQNIIAAQWQGPLPPPDALDQFNRILPNGAERIMRMVEEEQAHRIAYENARLAALTADTRRGHYLGGLISLVAIAAAAVAALGAHW